MLESAFRHLPGAMDHPGLLHLHVHLMEVWPHPEAALVTANRLRTPSPGMGHLTHMPTHIDTQCGHYRDAMHWNQRAIVADRKYYVRPRRADNFRFPLSDPQLALRRLECDVPRSVRTRHRRCRADRNHAGGGAAHSHVTIGQHVLIHFGKWRKIIAQDLRADRDLYCNTVAVTHDAKGVAHATLGDVPAAQAEQALFRETAKREPKSRQIHNVSRMQLLATAEESRAGTRPGSGRRQSPGALLAPSPAPVYCWPRIHHPQICRQRSGS